MQRNSQKKTHKLLRIQNAYLIRTFFFQFMVFVLLNLDSHQKIFGIITNKVFFKY